MPGTLLGTEGMKVGKMRSLLSEFIVWWRRQVHKAVDEYHGRLRLTAEAQKRNQVFFGPGKWAFRIVLTAGSQRGLRGCQTGGRCHSQSEYISAKPQRLEEYKMFGEKLHGVDVRLREGRNEIGKDLARDAKDRMFFPVSVRTPRGVCKQGGDIRTSLWKI